MHPGGSSKFASVEVLDLEFYVVYILQEDIEQMRRQLEIMIERRQKEKEEKMQVQRRECELAIQRHAEKLLGKLGAKASSDLQGGLLHQSISSNFGVNGNLHDGSSQAEHRHAQQQNRSSTDGNEIRQDLAGPGATLPGSILQFRSAPHLESQSAARYNYVRVADLLEYVQIAMQVFHSLLVEDDMTYFSSVLQLGI